MFHQLGFSFVIGIGQIKSNFARKSIYEFLVNLKADLPNILSPYSRVSNKIIIGVGNTAVPPSSLYRDLNSCIY